MKSERTSSKCLYRTRNGIVCGVCSGLANYSEIHVFWVRITVVAAAILTGFFPVIVGYFVAAFFMKPAPVVAPLSDEDEEFYSSFANSRAMALARLKRKFDQLERRTRRIESLVTAREYAWEHRLRTGQ